ncbi:AzlC family ABC transporter permease [Aquibacillus sp. 3ASR75-11]|uniref:AzlC family ABC transporter permease n=1 Tax=Terrihalobacillus insolitus TaxID=2950438 RepID=A0A9X3WWG9_9BACI|nr:AzlC family ABC transporter permease [Terrihalobacillus insolitus]MDC3413564.1 AzlC family ABC transporter permease [Terrihalobacillus insolitus]MDC3424679.1 AzlC family ABC transporter permease [Terrihalobacillus insolitus]
MLSKAIEKTQPSPALAMIQKGLSKGFPIVIGYLPIAIAYGVLAKQAGMSNLDLTLMSVLVFAGASQFMAANMVIIGSGVIEIIIATFVLNFRHFVMSFSFMNRVREMELKWKAPLTLGLTDETFAVSSLHTEEAKKEKGALFYATLMFIAYSTWVIGSLLGGLLGDIIPEALGQSMGIALYAMFIGLLIPSVKKEWRIGCVAVIAMVSNFLFSQFLDQGWAIVLGTILGGSSGMILLKEEKR